MLDRLSVRRTVVVYGPRAADHVWDSYVRPQRWPEWSPQIRSVDYPAETLRPHTGGVVHGPVGLRAGFRITGVDPAGPVRSWTWSVSMLGVRLVLRHTVEPVAGGTRTGLTVDGPAPLVIGYLPVARSALRRLVSRDR
ncbi:hypothetical protein ACWT_6079 [Actinoplanes sp. SE50]|uniref:SRPBCC family protein n=1 Tax=unclassified Actinoplanes TaxID=2626549 RepID=UPI00023ECA11|nr:MULTISPECIES: SRPBCC family protein [unclassified Actinoplanes]AEV87096.1 hypothetical protein ACPL_6211 [Actinoplanes sp. SE50/110]ATO85494.1 hypothetical protein ACWT_6079 [Actinoplanes sp. SE50]SLM02906.1 hypothetical protein ACSP50_6191 [Actinoplanes sp. SE50/110]